MVGVTLGGGWWWTHRPSDAAVNSTGGTVSLSQEESPQPSGSGKDMLSVKPSDGSAGQALGSSSGSSGGSMGASNSIPINGLPSASDSRGNASNEPPGPDGFEVYEQYKTSETALYADLSTGTGPDVKAGSMVTVNYRGWLTNGQLFDESYSRGQPYSFVEGAHAVILGWEQTMFGMKVGGKRRLIVPPKVGYGAEAKGSIPANSLLVFDVELVAVKDQ